MELRLLLPTDERLGALEELRLGVLMEERLELLDERLLPMDERLELLDERLLTELLWLPPERLLLTELL